MSPEEQRVAIAEVCGMSQVGYRDGMLFGVDGGSIVEVPDYLSDLNAMHEAEMWVVEKIGWDFQRAFAHCLTEVAMRRREGSNPTQALFWCSCSTAAQHSEAFLKAVGKWKD